jgi:hypothetical protein
MKNVRINKGNIEKKKKKIQILISNNSTIILFIDNENVF